MAVLFATCYFSIPQFKEEINTAVDVLTGEDEERIQRWVSTFGIFGPVVIVAGMMVQMFLFVVPNVLLMMIAIVSYGPVWGGIISFVGVFAASSFGYFIGGKLSKVTLAKFVSIENQRKIAQFIQDYGMGTIMITRLSSFSNDGLSLVAGMLKMEYKKYIVSTLIGITPLIVVLAIFGKNEKIEWALIWVTAASLIMLVIYIIVDKKRKKKKKMGTVGNIQPETSSGAKV
ncbi:MAG TPA: VTT domain-containing protein [Chryseolinea sp.]|nr:VTT domain-containing protein [Chryseolinea sp.]